MDSSGPRPVEAARIVVDFAAVRRAGPDVPRLTWWRSRSTRTDSIPTSSRSVARALATVGARALRHHGPLRTCPSNSVSIAAAPMVMLYRVGAAGRRPHGEVHMAIDGGVG